MDIKKIPKQCAIIPVYKIYFSFYLNSLSLRFKSLLLLYPWAWNSITGIAIIQASSFGLLMKLAIKILCFKQLSIANKPSTVAINELLCMKNAGAQRAIDFS